MRIIAGLLVASTAVASAQPGMTLPAPSAYRPAQLDSDDRAVLARGEITDDQRVGGAIAGALFGFGTGQAAQGRWHDRGWLFTVGDSVAGGAMFAGVLGSIRTCPSTGLGRDCSGPRPTLLIGSVVALVVLRIWQTADAIVVPPRHNRRVRALRDRLGPAPDGSLALRF